MRERTNMATTSGWTSRLKRPAFLWANVAAATQIAVQVILKHEALSAPARSVLGFLPALVWIFFIVSFVLDVRRRDELQRLIHLQAASIAFVLTVVLTLLLSALESAGLYRATWNWIGTPSMLLWAIAYISLASRYPC
jgi:hypothetical protein